MLINNYFCPICGLEVTFLIDKLCFSCYKKKVVLFNVVDVLHIIICEQCHSFNHKNKWEKYHSIYTAFQTFVFENIKINKSFKDIDIKINIFKQVSQYVYQLLIEAELNSDYGLIKKQKKIEIRLKRMSCIICSKKSGGYFEAILQFRSDSGSLSNEQEDYISKFVLKLINKYNLNGDSLSFISQIIKEKEGLDYYIGSTNVAKKIGKNLSKIFCCVYKESYTLIGVKDGIKTYRTTISIKISKFKIGDIHYFEKNVIIIIKIYLKLTILDLKTFSTKSIELNQFQKSIYLGNKFNNTIETSIIFIEQNILNVLDIISFKIFKIEKPKLFDFKIGESITIFQCEYGVFIII